MIKPKDYSKKYPVFYVSNIQVLDRNKWTNDWNGTTITGSWCYLNKVIL
jgi:hypothetical protein